MRRLLFGCTITTLSACIAPITVAQEQQIIAAFDEAEPVLEDNLPPGKGIAAIDDGVKTFELQNEAALMAGANQTISSTMQPFNSMRIKLIQALQKTPKQVVINGQVIPLHHPERVATFYRNAQYPTVWTLEQQFTDKLPALKQLIANAEADALNPQHYHAQFIMPLQSGVDYNDIIAYELLLSDAYLTLVGDLANGLVDPTVTHREWNAPPVDDELLGKLFAKAIVDNDLIGAVERINADNPRYQALKQAYNHLRLSDPSQRNQLDSLMINMERQRWLPQFLGDTYILVNIPSYRVVMYRNNLPIYETKSIVGKPSRPTPAFIDRMRHIVMSPTWTVPPTIMRKDKLPKLRRNPGAFDGAYEAITPSGKVVAPSSVNWSNGGRGYALRQKPGAHNALGRIKFLFPNKHAIYLHDTPSKNLFNRTERAYSSGCVRIQDPLDFANVLLQGTQWTPDSIRKATQQNRERWVDPPQETPIYLVYWTNWADPDGTMHQANDIYHLDKRLLKQYNSALNTL